MDGLEVNMQFLISLFKINISHFNFFYSLNVCVIASYLHLHFLIGGVKEMQFFNREFP